jgi:AraC-like DNA-binding protein
MQTALHIRLQFDADGARTALCEAPVASLCVPPESAWRACVPLGAPRRLLASIERWAPQLDQVLLPGSFGLLAPGHGYLARWLGSGPASFLVIDLPTDPLTRALRGEQQGFHFDQALRGLAVDTAASDVDRLAAIAIRARNALAEPRFAGAQSLEWSIRGYLQRTPAERQSIEGLAAALGCSPTALSRRCRRELHCSPYQFVRHWRLQRARELVESSDWPLSEVAVQYGFADQSHLTHAFRKAFGRPPARARRRAMSKHA